MKPRIRLYSAGIWRVKLPSGHIGMGHSMLEAWDDARTFWRACQTG